MPHVLIAGRIDPAGLELLGADPGVTLRIVEDASPSAFLPYLAEADAILLRTQPLTAQLISGATRLRIVSRHGVGFEAIDVAALEARGIVLATVGDVNSQSVAEHAFALMLALAKQLVTFDAATRAGAWQTRDGFSATELAGKTLLIVGFGRIGRRVAAMAAAFGMVVLASDPFVPSRSIRDAGAKPVGSLAEGLEQADIVSLHLPAVEGGALIGKAELGRVRPGALLVNTARGGLVDEAALADALDAGRLAGAGLDVFAAEPPDIRNRLLASPRVVATPHVAALTRECAVRMSRVAAQNILDFFAGRLDPSMIVDTRQPGLA